MDVTTRESKTLVEAVTIRRVVLEDDRDLESIYARARAGEHLPDTLFE